MSMDWAKEIASQFPHKTLRPGWGNLPRCAEVAQIPVCNAQRIHANSMLHQAPTVATNSSINHEFMGAFWDAARRRLSDNRKLWVKNMS
jgi:hypothetical protein